jgi:hypothetical protein
MKRGFGKVCSRKRLKNKTLSQVVKQPGDSQFLAGLKEIKEQFLERRKF